MNIADADRGHDAGLLEIESQLRDELEIARKYCETADLDFWRIAADVFSPDHTRQVERAARLQTISRKYLLRALGRLNAFLVYGTIPEDLSIKAEQHKAQAA